MTNDEGDMSPLHLATLHLHEFFLSLQESGFTEDQALKLLAFTLVEKQMGDS